MQPKPDLTHTLTPRGQRRNQLVGMGVPTKLLGTIKSIGKRKDSLKDYLSGEDDAYAYLQTSNWDDLVGSTITPIATEFCGESYYLAVTFQDRSEFVYFELESGIVERFSSIDELIKHMLSSAAEDVGSDTELQDIALEFGYSGTLTLADFGT